MTVTCQQAEPFGSLAALQAEHSRLQAELFKNSIGGEAAEQVAAFVQRSVLTGARLDNRSDRQAAQAIINYWMSRAGSFPHEESSSEYTLADPEFDSLLADFESSTLQTAVEAVEQWLISQPDDEPLAKRIMLRLMRLRDDDSFDIAPATESVFEDLEPRKDAQRILDKLADLGVVRISSDSSGRREISLRSPDLVDKWPRLQKWREERKQFREKAARRAQQGTEKAANPSAFTRRAERSLRKIVLGVGAWIDVRWGMLLSLLGIQSTERVLTEHEYEEAEAYRDLNAAELRLIYQQRQLDRERLERKQARATIFAAVALGFAALFVFAIVGWWLADNQRDAAEKAKLVAEKATSAAREATTVAEEAAKAAKKAEIAETEAKEAAKAAEGIAKYEKGEAEKAKKRLALQIATEYFERGVRLMASRDKDASGAFLWSVNAFGKVRSAVDVEVEAERERLLAHSLVRLGVAQRQLPRLAGIVVERTKVAKTACSSDGQVVLTVWPNERDQKLQPTATVWRWSDGKWVGLELSWQGSPQDIAAVTNAFLNQDGSVGIVTTSENEAGKVFVWSINADDFKHDENNATKKSSAKTFTHAGSLPNASISPDGQWFGGVTSENVVMLRHASDWTQAMSLQLPKTVTGPGNVAFSPRSDRMALAIKPNSAASGGELVVCLEWRLESLSPTARANEEVRPTQYIGTTFYPSFQEEQTTFVAYGPEVKDKEGNSNQALFVTSGSESGSQNIWLFNTGSDSHPSVPALSYHRASILHATFSSLGDQMATADANGLVFLWPLQIANRSVRASTPKRIAHDDRSVYYCDFSPDGKYLATASRDRMARIWDVDNLELAHPSFQHTGTVNIARFTQDGRQLITESRGITYRWDLVGDRPLLAGGMPRQIDTLSADVQGHAILATGGQQSGFVQIGSAGWAQVWDAKSGTPRTPSLPHFAGVRQAAIGPDNTGFVSTVDAEGTMRVWNVNVPERPICTVETDPWPTIYTAFGLHEQKLLLLAVNREEPRLAAEKPRLSNDRSKVRVWSLGGNGMSPQPTVYNCDEAALTHAAFSPDCKWLVGYTGEGLKGKAVVWKVGREKEPIPLKRKGSEYTHAEAITSVAFNTQGDRLITTSRDNQAVVWFLPETKEALREVEWELLAGRKEDDIQGHTADILSAAFDPTGQRIVTADDREAIVWEAPERRSYRPKTLLNLKARPIQILFTPEKEQRYILAAGIDATTRLWDAKDGREVATKQHPGQVRQLIATTDGNDSLKILVFGILPVRGRTGPPGASTEAILPLALSRPMVSEWDLTPAKNDTPKQLEELTQLAELTAGRRLATEQDLVQATPLAAEAMHDYRQIPGFSQRKEIEAIEWHEREASWYESVSAWTAAQWRLNRALENRKDAPPLALIARRALIRLQAAQAAQDEARAKEEWEKAAQDLTEVLKDPKQNRDLLLARAEVLVHLKRHREAIEDYKNALEIIKEDNLTRAQLAEAYSKDGQFAAAVDQYNQAEECDEKNPNLFLNRAIARMKMKDPQKHEAYRDYVDAGRLFKARWSTEQAVQAYSGAVSLLNEEIDSSRQAAEVHAELAEVQINRGRYQDAKGNFLKATQLDASVWTYWSGLARTYEYEKEPKKARMAYERALDLNRNDINLAIAHARSLIQTEDWNEAAKAYQAIIAREPLVSSHRLRLAEIYLLPSSPDKEALPKQLEEARRCLVKAIEDIPSVAILHSRLAVVQLAAGNTDQYEATRAAMLKAFRAPTAEDANSVAWTSVFASDTPEGAEYAVLLAKKAVSFNLRNTNFLNTYGAVLYRAQRHEDAIKQLSEATALRPRNFPTYGNALDLLFTAMARYPSKPEQARVDLQSAVKIAEEIESRQKSVSPMESLNLVWDRLEFDLLRREAESLINQGSEQPPPTPRTKSQ